MIRSLARSLGGGGGVAVRCDVLCTRVRVLVLLQVVGGWVGGRAGAPGVARTVSKLDGCAALTAAALPFYYLHESPLSVRLVKCPFACINGSCAYDILHVCVCVCVGVRVLHLPHSGVLLLALGLLSIFLWWKFEIFGKLKVRSTVILRPPTHPPMHPFLSLVCCLADSFVERSVESGGSSLCSPPAAALARAPAATAARVPMLLEYCCS